MRIKKRFFFSGYLFSLLIVLMFLGGGLISIGQAQQPDSNTTLVGRYANGPSNGVAVDGDYAYFGNGGYLEIADISDSSNPVQAGQVLTPSVVEGVAKNGDYVYVANGEAGLRIIDVSSQAEPTEIGSYKIGIDDANEVRISNGYAYVAGGDSGLVVIDVSTPSNPTLAGSYEFENFFAWDVAVSGNYAYVAGFSDGLRVIDVSNPAEPTEVASVIYMDGARYVRTNNVAISGDYAYTSNSDDTLRVIDMSDPSDPVETGTYEFEVSAESVTISGDHAFITDRGGGLEIIDISNSSNPARAGYLETEGYSNDVAISGEVAYLADGWAGLQLIDVSTSTNPVMVGSYETGSATFDVALNGDYAYLANVNSGMQIIDVSSPQNPARTGSFANGNSIWAVTVSGNYAYLRASDLFVIDVSNPSDPTEVSSINGDINQVFADGEYVYITDTSGEFVGVDDKTGLRIIDASNPSDPTETGFFEATYAEDVELNGDYAYMADGYAGLRIIDVSDPSNPVEAASIEPGDLGDANKVAVSDEYAYVVNNDNGNFYAIDISNPSDPVEVAFKDYFELVAVAGGAQEMTVSGNYVYMAVESSGLVMIDVSDPAEPAKAGYYETGDEARGLVVDGENTFLADGEDGMYIISNDQVSTDIDNSQYQAPREFSLQPNHPNPFNPTTRIKFNLPRTSDVQLTVYDVLGRQVATLIEEKRQAGRHSVTFDAGSLSSGVYIYRLRTNEFNQSRKMLLVK